MWKVGIQDATLKFDPSTSPRPPPGSWEEMGGIESKRTVLEGIHVLPSRGAHDPRVDLEVRGFAKGGFTSGSGDRPPHVPGRGKVRKEGSPRWTACSPRLEPFAHVIPCEKRTPDRSSVRPQYGTDPIRRGGQGTGGVGSRIGMGRRSTHRSLDRRPLPHSHMGLLAMCELLGTFPLGHPIVGGRKSGPRGCG